MKIKHTSLALFMFFSMNSFSQSKYKVGAARFDTYSVDYATNTNLARIYGVLGNESFNSEKENEYKYFVGRSENKRTKFSLDFLIKRKNKNLNPWLHHEFTVGVEYGKAVTNSFKFYREEVNGGINFPYDNGLWVLAIFANSTDYATMTTIYRYESEVIALRVKEMIWALNGSYFSFGFGIKGSLGFKMNSKITKTILLGSRSESLFSSSSASSIHKVYEYNDRNGMIGNISLPIELAFRFSKNKESSFYYTKLIGHANFGAQGSFFSKRKESTSYTSLGFGLQVGF